MHYLQNIFIGITALVSGFFGGAGHLYGTTLTTLLGSDRQNTFPTTYNANNTALNNGKIEVGTTSVASITTLQNLSSIGTITTGVWNATALLFAKGGVASTSLSANQVLLGNGTNGFMTVTGWGSSGQFLTSNGTTLAPTWQSGSFDVTGTYVNTGVWTFATSTTYNGNFGTLTATTSVRLPASLNINSVAYTAPASQGATDSILSNNGSGTLSWGNFGAFLGTTTASSSISYSASVDLTVATATIPANTLRTNNLVYIHIPITTLNISNGFCNISSIKVKWGGTTIYDSGVISAVGGYTANEGHLDIYLWGNGQTNNQYSRTELFARGQTVAFNNTDKSIFLSQSTPAAVDSTASQNLFVTVQYLSTSGSCQWIADYGVITVLRK